VELDGNTKQFNTFLYYGLSTVDRKQFPTKGAEIQFEAGMIHNQNPDLRVTLEGVAQNIDSLGYNFSDYQRVLLKMNYYFPFSKKSTLIVNGYAGFNFNYSQILTNDFLIGGLTDFTRNQIPFMGLYHGEVNTSSVASASLGFQYEALRNIFITPKASFGAYDFNGVSETKYNYVTGYGVTFGYSTRLGPLEASVMYSDQAQYLKAYVNLGFHF
jgi:NTE family protein